MTGRGRKTRGSQEKTAESDSDTDSTSDSDSNSVVNRSSTSRAFNIFYEYDIQFDDGDFEKNVAADLIRTPTWYWLDKGERGASPNHVYHSKIYLNGIGELKAGDVVRISVGSSKGKLVRHKDRCACIVTVLELNIETV